MFKIIDISRNTGKCEVQAGFHVATLRYHMKDFAISYYTIE